MNEERLLLEPVRKWKVNLARPMGDRERFPVRIVTVSLVDFKPPLPHIPIYE